VADFDALRRDLGEFVAERNWSQFHDPKSLLLALTAEVGELCEVFQWVPAADAAERARDEPTRGEVADEIADVLIYLLHLADAVGVDAVEAAASKLQRNRSRFPPPSTTVEDLPEQGPLK
jgi:dCTP diphosphatase